MLDVILILLLSYNDTMKKQTKAQLISKYITDKSDKIIAKIQQKASTLSQMEAEKTLNKPDMFSSPNKQNQFSTANQSREVMWSPLSPVLHKQPLSPVSHYCYNSPLKTINHENLDYFRSNKGKEMLKVQPTNNILFSGFSKDGKYKVESHSLVGEDLTKAVQHERKVNLANILQARKEKDKTKVPAFAAARTSNKENGVIKSYAVNTHQGISRNYNEDRVSITLNIKKNGVKAHFFAIYDGHGGSLCCQFLKDTIHQLLINNNNFPQDPKKALIEVIGLAEEKFTKLARGTKNKDNMPDKSGSCLLICVVVDDVCYIANVGDSRAILSTEGGRFAFNLSRDHRPTDVKEQDRVIAAGGKIYRTEMLPITQKSRQEKILGPLRIYPGKLSVSRTIGDIEAKEEQFGGIKNIVSCQPQIKKFRLTGKEDFIVMCCDGILQRMESMQVVQTAWTAMRSQGSMHEKAGKAVDSLMRESMARKSSDNLTVIMMCLGELNVQCYRSPRKLLKQQKQLIS